MSEHRMALYLQNILLHIKFINEFVGDMTYDQFVEDDKTLNAVYAKLIQIAENVKKLHHLDADVPTRHPELPFHAIIGMRNRLVHEYDIIDDEKVWAAVGDLPRLKAVVESEIGRADEKL